MHKSAVPLVLKASESVMFKSLILPRVQSFIREEKEKNGEMALSGNDTR